MTKCIKMRGKKGEWHPDPDDPPRRRANKVRGHGTWDRDRPPVFGIVGRQTGHVRLAVLHPSTRNELEPQVLGATVPGACVNSDEWEGYSHLEEADRCHVTVCHAPGKREWARDDDGDGIREVHNNTWKASGQDFAITFAAFVACTRSTSINTWRFSNGPTMSKQPRSASFVPCSAPSPHTPHEPRCFVMCSK